MAIKDPILFITVEDFKSWKGFNALEFDSVTTPDNEIWFAISVASQNIDWLSGFSISKKWPEQTPTNFTDDVQTATANYVRFLLTKDSNYIRGQSSISQGGLNYSEQNPNDPYYIVPEVFQLLRKIKEYPNFKGYDLNLQPKRNEPFSTFFSNKGENPVLSKYLQIVNLESLDTRTKLVAIHDPSRIGTIIAIDTRLIKDLSTLTTQDLFNSFFSNDAFQLVDGKQGQKEKVISLADSDVDLFSEYAGNQFQFTNLTTIAKTLTGAINELKAGSTGGDSYTKEEINKIINGLEVIISQLNTDKQAKLIPNGNIEILTDGKIRAFDASFDNNRFTKNYSLYDSKDGFNISDLIILTAGNIYKYYQEKLKIDENSFRLNNNFLSLDDTSVRYRINNILTYPELKTDNKTIIGAINEKSQVWKQTGSRQDRYQWTNTFITDKTYRVRINWNTNNTYDTYKEIIFKYKSGNSLALESYIVSANNSPINSVYLSVSVSSISINQRSGTTMAGNICSLEILEI